MAELRSNTAAGRPTRGHLSTCLARFQPLLKASYHENRDPGQQGPLPNPTEVQQGSTKANVFQAMRSCSCICAPPRPCARECARPTTGMRRLRLRCGDGVPRRRFKDGGLRPLAAGEIQKVWWRGGYSVRPCGRRRGRGSSRAAIRRAHRRLEAYNSLCQSCCNSGLLCDCMPHRPPIERLRARMRAPSAQACAHTHTHPLFAANPFTTTKCASGLYGVPPPLTSVN